MNRFIELKLTKEQELFVDQWMFKWGAWVNTERLNKSNSNVIYRLMKSIAPSNSSYLICTDEEGEIISRTIDLFFYKNDKPLRKLLFMYYVLRKSICNIAQTLRQKAIIKTKITKIPSLRTFQKHISKELYLAKTIIYDILLIELCSKNKTTKTYIPTFNK
ncbi:antiterminator Q family protein [Actinobacillus equuli subsp. equuli]|uniref:antiterminator Q family protein n=1 Tax=Actinobacillus equuli TaxID=718 RepID=UPI002440FFBD|nr:antiterminator Q family protein [Actinobacillus equuli]WGE55625.1 antiterminator Q family protein [Actinobacillus equuli subsp. equuli]